MCLENTESVMAKGDSRIDAPLQRKTRAHRTRVRRTFGVTRRYCGELSAGRLLIRLCGERRRSCSRADAASVDLACFSATYWKNPRAPSSSWAPSLRILFLLGEDRRTSTGLKRGLRLPTLDIHRSLFGTVAKHHTTELEDRRVVVLLLEVDLTDHEAGFCAQFVS